MEDIDRRMTIAEGQLSQAPQRNWQGAPVHVSARLVVARTTYSFANIEAVVIHIACGHYFSDGPIRVAGYHAGSQSGRGRHRDAGP